MIRHVKSKIKKKRFGKIKALFKDEHKRHRFLGTLEFDDLSDFEEEDEYEADDEEYESAEEELAAEFFDFGI